MKCLPLGPLGITQFIPREVSGVIEVKFITPIHSLRNYLVSSVVCSFLIGTRQESVFFFLELGLINPQKLFGVIGGAIIAPILFKK